MHVKRSGHGADMNAFMGRAALDVRNVALQSLVESARERGRSDRDRTQAWELVGKAENAAVAAEGGWRAVFSPAPVFRKTGKGG